MGDFKAFSSPIKRTDVENVPRFSFSWRVEKKKTVLCPRLSVSAVSAWGLSQVSSKTNEPGISDGEH